jgi:5-methylcytosine-specific restriction endonuclease McrA
MTPRTKATDITPKVRAVVKRRDNNTCVNCGRKDWVQLCHVFYNRSHAGLGVKENLVCLCVECHNKLDAGRIEVSEPIRKVVESYLMSHYPNINVNDLKYKKGVSL